MSEPDIIGHELSLTRIIAASPDKLYRAWTEPELLKQWFAPSPFTTTTAQLDVRPGGANLIVMRGPDGVEYPNHGVYLKIIPGRKLVFTDAFASAWIPSAKPFMTAVITFDAIGEGQTRYTARALHWSAEDRETHEAMGFHEGWGQCADQLAALASSL